MRRDPSSRLHDAREGKHLSMRSGAMPSGAWEARQDGGQALSPSLTEYEGASVLRGGGRLGRTIY